MRVLAIIHLYPPHHLGGYEIACRGAMERFAEHGIEVVVLTADKRLVDEGRDESAGGVHVVRQLKGWWDWDAWKPLRPSLIERTRIERHNQKVLKETMARFRPDVASVWDLGMASWTLGTLIEKQKVPIVLTFLDDWIAFAYVFDAWSRIFDRRPWARPLGDLLGLETRLPTFAGALASVASETIARAIARNSRWKFPDATLNPIGVDTSEFPVSQPRADPWSWRLMYSGRVIADKGVPTLIKSLSHLPPEVHLDIVGFAHDKDLEDMKALARRVGAEERVSFSVAGSRQDLRRRYQSADLVVFPSEWAEPFGIVPLEAMASGTPVLATGTGGSGEYLRDGENCVIFRAGDAEDLARQALRIAEDGELRSRIVGGGSATAGHLTMDRFADELERLHRQAASR